MPPAGVLQRRVSSGLLTTGEPEHSRCGVREPLERRCADVLQPDITWLGGITEARLENFSLISSKALHGTARGGRRSLAGDDCHLAPRSPAQAGNSVQSAACTVM